MADFKPIETQEEFDKMIESRLARQKETIESSYSDYPKLQKQNKELGEQVESLTTASILAKENEGKYKTQIDDMSKKITGYEKSQLRTQIALKNGLPYDLAERLIGDDETSIQADAERLSSFVKNTTKVAPLKSTETPAANGIDSAYKSLVENLNTKGE